MRIFLMTSVLAVSACSRHADQVAPPAPSSPRVLSPMQLPPPRVDPGLVGELSREAASRPTGTPRIEEILASLERGGIAILRKQQVLAAPIGARYCVAAVSRMGLNMSICEFESADQAKAGRDKSLAMFKSIQHRTLILNAKTLLTLILVRDEAPIRAQRDEAERRFRALSGK